MRLNPPYEISHKAGLQDLDMDSTEDESSLL